MTISRWPNSKTPAPATRVHELPLRDHSHAARLKRAQRAPLARAWAQPRSTKGGPEVVALQSQRPCACCGKRQCTRITREVVAKSAPKAEAPKSEWCSACGDRPAAKGCTECASCMVGRIMCEPAPKAEAARPAPEALRYASGEEVRVGDRCELVAVPWRVYVADGLRQYRDGSVANDDRVRLHSERTGDETSAPAKRLKLISRAEAAPAGDAERSERGGRS